MCPLTSLANRVSIYFAGGSMVNPHAVLLATTPTFSTLFPSGGVAAGLVHHHTGGVDIGVGKW